MNLCLQGIQLENNSYNQQQQQQTAPITIDQQQQRHHQQQQQHQQHSPNHQSYPTNQMNEKLMSYRNTASPTNLSSSQGNLSKVKIQNLLILLIVILIFVFLSKINRIAIEVHTIDRVLEPVLVFLVLQQTLIQILVHRAVRHLKWQALMGL